MERGGFHLTKWASNSPEEDGLTSYLILDVLEAKILRCNFMEGHNVWGNVRYSSSTHRNIVAILATNFQDLGRQSEKFSRIEL